MNRPLVQIQRNLMSVVAVVEFVSQTIHSTGRKNLVVESEMQQKMMNCCWPADSEGWHRKMIHFVGQHFQGLCRLGLANQKTNHYFATHFESPMKTETKMML